MEDVDGQKNDRLPFRSLPLAQREVALLLVLCIISGVMFAGTRRLATWSRDRRAQAAAQWFTRGEALARAGDLEAGTAALREAVAADRQNPHYVLALARSLADSGRNDEARQLLLQVRQAQPDDVEVNYRLARLAALGHEQTDAIRYYNYAMYGLARVGADRDRGAIRAELITYLIDEGERQEAVNELSALDRDLPDTVPAQLEAAHLADKVGEARLALGHYTKAGRLDSRNAEAAAGAGEAGFALRDYALAARELARAVALGAPAAPFESRLEIASLIVANDPLSARVASSERTRRLLAGLVRVSDHYAACAQATGADPKAPDATQAEFDRLRRQPRAGFQDPDVLARAVEAIGAAEVTLRTRCPTSTEPIDRAWELIAGMHQGGGA